MKSYLKLLLVGLLAASAVYGCKNKNKARQYEPAKAGERGSTCVAKNDCDADYSCIQGLCQPVDFDVNTTTKECFRVECEEQADCCGTKLLTAPARCREQATLCTPTLPGCSQGDFCTSDASCTGGGVCAGGFRSCGYTGLSCSDALPCEANFCDVPGGLGGGVQGTCSLSFQVCDGDEDCFSNACGSGSCDCTNPEQDLTNPICTDEECENVCTKVCMNELCVEDTACEDDIECFGTRDMCDAGACVECKVTADCDDELDEEDDLDECREGTCVTPCEYDTECPFFNVCEEGSCVYIGCQSNNECILLGGTGGTDDPRMATCQKGSDGIGTCVTPCEVDAHCPASHVCQAGACNYVGCTNNIDCKSILGLHGEMTGPDKDWITQAVCREPVLP